MVTRRAILEAAGSEFVKHGYSGTGLGSIVTRAELTKGALFHHFSDKRAMALAWIEDLLEPAIGECWIAPLAEIGTLDGLKSFLRGRCLALEAHDATSALVAMTAETATADATLAGALERIFARWRTALAEWIERGKAGGWIHRSIQPESESMLLVAAISGFCVALRCGVDDAARRNGVTALEAYLETLRAQ